MILFQNEIVQLDYDAETGILQVLYSDLYTYPLPVIKHNIDLLVEVIIAHNIEKVLLDSSRTTYPVSKEDSREVARAFAAGLIRTNVKKVARLQSPVFVLEATVRSNIASMKLDAELPFLMESFTNRDDALEWLMTWEELLLT